MKVLFVTGANLRKNESANLSHIAYIRGFCELGWDVIVISQKNPADVIDESIEIPDKAKIIEIESSILYRYVKKETRQIVQSNYRRGKKTIKGVIFSLAKRIVKQYYGLYGYNQAWINNLVKNITLKEHFDLMISMSTPIESHEAAYILRRKKLINCDVFCEIWEDPWQLDIYNKNPNKKLIEKEYEITSFADKVIYVSPITLEYQKRMFPNTASKMNWLPLASYYKSVPNNVKGIQYGYFGTYFPDARNLRPFYEAAVKLNRNFVICGNPAELFERTERIEIYPRLSLEELSKYEEKTNILVFICNLKGGQIPGKLYQYAATNKKVLFILDGTDEEKRILKSIFEKYNRFYFCENNVIDICQTMKYLESDNDPQKIAELHDFDPIEIAKGIIDICDIKRN